MRIRMLLVGLVGGALVGLAPGVISSARAQPPATPPTQSQPAPGGARYQYHVVNLGWSNAQAAEDLFNKLGQEGWRVAAQAGSYVTFERTLPAR